MSWGALAIQHVFSVKQSASNMGEGKECSLKSRFRNYATRV
jgi:hypothetical protein